MPGLAAAALALLVATCGAGGANPAHPSSVSQARIEASLTDALKIEPAI